MLLLREYPPHRGPRTLAVQIDISSIIIMLQLYPWDMNPWRGEQQPTPVFLSEESPGQRSLVGYSPWGHSQTQMKD